MILIKEKKMAKKKFERKRVIINCGKTETNKGRTQQQFKDETNINNIMRKYERTGVLPEMRKEVQSEYGDFSNVATYQESLNLVINAHEAFDSLPARVRREFGDDPLKMVAFCENKDNLERARELGLAKPIPVNEGEIPIGTAQSGEKVKIEDVIIENGKKSKV